MTQSIDRRTVLKSSAAVAAAGPFAGLVAGPALGNQPPDATALGPIPDERDGVVRLHLPEGFRYRSFHDTEFPVTLLDGTALPGRHDGMGAFEAPGSTVLLVRNHEVTTVGPAFGPGAPYDPMAGGGTTTIQVTKKGEVIKSFTSLNGTMFNCSGGQMPWGSWITCEETVNGPDVGPDFANSQNHRLAKPHGYVFEVPVSRFPGKGQSSRKPIKSAGRFAHEAVSFDPVNGHLYLTEDNFAFASGFYRYEPPANPMDVGELRDGGTLKMLAVKGTTNAHLEGAQVAGTEYDVEWKTIPQPDVLYPYVPGEVAPTKNDTALVHVSTQGWDQGTAYFSRLEGQVYDDGIVYFTSTQGGGAAQPGRTVEVGDTNGYGNGTGQVWAYDIARQKLRVVYQSPNAATLDFPDNITTSARGSLVVCEDNVNDNFIRGLSPEGHIWDIALNRLVSQIPTPNTDPPVFPTRFNDEFAGSTFSPDGHTLFVNIQASRGLTFAIWGPWESIGV
jgi:secreted PhoX family phosphatase